MASRFVALAFVACGNKVEHAPALPEYAPHPTRDDGGALSMDPSAQDGAVTGNGPVIIGGVARRQMFASLGDAVAYENGLFLAANRQGASLDVLDLSGVGSEFAVTTASVALGGDPGRLRYDAAHHVALVTHSIGYQDKTFHAFNWLDFVDVSDPTTPKFDAATDRLDLHGVGMDVAIDASRGLAYVIVYDPTKIGIRDSVTTVDIASRAIVSVIPFDQNVLLGPTMGRLKDRLALQGETLFINDSVFMLDSSKTEYQRQFWLNGQYYTTGKDTWFSADGKRVFLGNEQYDIATHHRISIGGGPLPYSHSPGDTYFRDQIFITDSKLVRWMSSDFDPAVTDPPGEHCLERVNLETTAQEAAVCIPVSNREYAKSLEEDNFMLWDGKDTVWLYGTKRDVATRVVESQFSVVSLLSLREPTH